MVPLFYPCPPPGASAEDWANYDRLIVRQAREGLILVWLMAAGFAGCLAMVAAMPFAIGFPAVCS